MNSTAARLACSVTFGLLVIAMTPAAQAVPQFDLNFTADTVGNAPAIAPASAGVVNTLPTFVAPGAELLGTSVLVQNTYTDTLSGNVFGTGNVLVFTDTNTSIATSLLLQGAVADETNSGVHTISFDWIEDTGVAATSSFFFGLTNQTRGQNLSSIFLDLGEPVGNIRSANSVNFGATIGTVTRGVAHHMDWVIDLDQTDFTIATEVYVDGNLLGTQRREPIGVPHDGASAFGNLQISSAAPAIGTVALDNIQIREGRHVQGNLHPGDFDGDGDVDGADFVAWQTNFPKESGGTLAQGDADGDGDVDGADFVVWQTNFPFAPGPGVAPVPEPAAMTLAIVAVAGLIALKRLAAA